MIKTYRDYQNTIYRKERKALFKKILAYIQSAILAIICLATAWAFVWGLSIIFN